MVQWTLEQLESIATSNDFHVAPFRQDGTTPGTLIWVWAVVVGHVVYVRTGNPSSRWFAAAIQQGAGHATGGGYAGLVTFDHVIDETVKGRVDAAFTRKYEGDAYFSVDLVQRSRAHIVAITPAA